MAKKRNRLQQLRDQNRRRQTFKRFLKGAIAVGVLVVLLVAGGYGAWQVPEVQSFVKSVVRGNRAGRTPLSPEYRQVGLQEAFPFAGGTLTIDSLHTSTGLRSAFGGGSGNEPAETFRPKNGAWLLVFVNFTGSTNADTGNMNPDTVQLVDEDNNVYLNHEHGSPAQDVYIQSNTTAYGGLRLMEAKPQHSVLLFDVSPQAKGLLLTFLREEEGRMKVLYGYKVSLKQPK